MEQQHPKTASIKTAQQVSTDTKVPVGYTTRSSENETYLTVIQVAQRLSLGKATIWRWTKDDKNLPKPIRFGKKATRWRLSDLIAFEPRALMGASSC
jgi:predicted DNA-binding transcriptional regulator AlpA